MSDSPRDAADNMITAAELADYDLTPQDVRRRCPWAIEYTGLDGSPCWLHADLAPLLADDEEDDV
jgi:hypothetical protein